MPSPKSYLIAFTTALLAPMASAATLQSPLHLEFDSEMPIGLGTMTFDGEAPGDGVYAVTDFTNLTFDFTFDPITDLGSFTEEDILVGTQPFSLVLIGETFHFTGEPAVPYGGSAGFVNAEGQYLTFSPSLVPYFAYAVFFDGPPPADGETSPNFGGTYGSITAIPEPSSAALLVGSAAIGLVGLRRRRA